MTQSQVCERGGELLPGAPSARPTPPAPPTEKRNPAGRTAPRGAGLLVGPARPGPRPPLGGARGRPTYLRVPTARPQAATAAAATAAGRGSPAPGPLAPPTSLGVGGPTWAAGSGHISAGGRQSPTPPLERRAAAARPALCALGSQLRLRAALREARRPGRWREARAPPARRRSPSWMPRRGEGPATSSSQPLIVSVLSVCASFHGPTPKRSLLQVKVHSSKE